MKAKVRFYPILFFICLICRVSAQNSDFTSIKWYSIEEAQNLSRSNSDHINLKQSPETKGNVKTAPETIKKIFIDIYTNWCGYCKRMDLYTFSNPFIINYINNHFIAVKLNAETTDSILFAGKIYINRQKRKQYPHDLAITLLNGQMSYPTYVILNEKLQIIGVAPGYSTPEQFEPVLKYFGEDAYKSINWQEYLARFKGELSN